MECLHFGTPPSNYKCWESKTFHIHNFLDLPDTKGNDNVVKLPKFKCYGHTWLLAVYPGGREKSSDGYVAVKIGNSSNEKISVDFKITLLDADGKESHRINKEMRVFQPSEGVGTDLVKRANLIENQSKYLVNKALKIKVQMRLSEGYHNRIRQHLPATDYRNIFGNETTCDVAFDFEDKILRAHKCIIQFKAEDFHVMCEGYSVTSPMKIDDVDKDIFRIMLFSLYGD